MFNVEDFKNELFLTDKFNFESKALELFEYQYQENPTYKSYCDYLKTDRKTVRNLADIPFLPIEFFKSHDIKTEQWAPRAEFLSSGTTKTGRSKHLIKDLTFYHQVARRAFNDLVGKIEDFTIAAILPSYQEQSRSSLISMIDHFLKYSHSGGYFLKNPEDLVKTSNDHSILLFGVTYALLELSYEFDRKEKLTIMDTGGMKGRKREITRNEVIAQLKKKYKQSAIWTEYGMTELSSQAYGIDGMLRFPEWVKAIVRDVNDPFHFVESGKTGGLNIIDLANVHSCAFIETKDLGKVHKTGFFEILGRFDNADIRGCSLLI